MKRILYGGAIVVLGGALACVGCSRDSASEGVDRLAKAAKTVIGGRTDGRPDIVAEQQRKEAVRQNTQWTPENQKNHPVEYCQAQLEVLGKGAKELEVAIHALSTQKARYERELETAKSKAAAMEKQLAEVKALYKAAETSGAWPIEYNGYKLSKEKAGQTLIQTKSVLEKSKGAQSALGIRLEKVSKSISSKQKEQLRVSELRERVQQTIVDLKTGAVSEAGNNISATLDSLSDSLKSFNADYEAPSFDDISTPTKASEDKAALDAILSE